MVNYAILIGVSNYFDHPNITNLDHSNEAIKRLKITLMEKAGFKSSNIKIFINQNKEQNPLTLPLKYSIISNLLKITIEWKNIQRDDFFLFYFIGHGYGSLEKGDQLLMMDSSFQFIKETALSAILLTQLIKQIPTNHKLIVFDCCRNEVKGVQGLQEGLGKDKIKEFMTLYACQPGELAWIPRKSKLPLLTQAFINAVNDENCLSIRDFNNKVIDDVYKKARKINVIQTPHLISEGQDLENIGFLSRKPQIKSVFTQTDKHVKNIKDINKKLKYLYEEKYPHYAPSFYPFINAAKGLMNWNQKLDRKTFRKLAFEFLEKGENADIYTVSYMLRWTSDEILFKPLIECLKSRKYRGTVTWQALDAIEVMLRDNKMIKLLSIDKELYKEMIDALKKTAIDHPTFKGPLFDTSVVWGKIRQICKRLELPEKDIFQDEVIK